MAASKEFVFKPAVRSHVNLLIGLAGASGSGKTYSAMRLAAGMSRGKRFAVIDSERGRAAHYADAFAFDHCEIGPPFRPSAYADAIIAADDAGYPVIVVDSMSHSWAGEGGVLDWQEAELDRMAGEDWKKREACKMAAWIKPKLDHKRMVQRLLQVRAQLILCFRAEEKVEMVREDGKTKIVPKQTATGLDGWVPLCEKSLPYELTASFLLTADAPGIPKPIKLQQQHRALFPLDKPLTEESGRLIAEWADGGSPSPGSATRAAAVQPSAPTVDEYAACPDRAAFDALERRRADAWKSLKTADKAPLKAASDAAAARIAAQAAPIASPTEADLRAAKNQVDLDKLWDAVQAAYAGGEIPLALEAAYDEKTDYFRSQETGQP